MLSEGLATEAVKVSLVIPLRDEERSVSALLESIAGQTRPPDEVVVVDAGSTDGTAAKVRSFVAPFPLVLLSRGALHPGEARNEGVAAASHEWIAFTDGGIELTANWLADLIAAVNDDIDVVFGSYAPVCPTTFQQAAAIAYVDPRTAAHTPSPSVPSMMLRRRAWAKTGGFLPFRAAEDLIFLETLRRSSSRTAFAPDAVAHWEIPGNARDLFRRFSLYSEHNLQAGRGRFWHWGVARLYAGLLVVLGLAWVFGARAPGVLGLVALFFLARAVKAAWRKRRDFAFDTLTPHRTLMAAAVLLLVDLATAVGALRWLARGRAGR